MDLDAARRYLRDNSRSILATVRSDGRPQMSPIVHAVDDGGRLLVSSREPAYKVGNVRRDRRVSLCAFPDSFYGEWVQVDGVAEIISLPDALPLLEDYYRRLRGEHPDWDDYRAAMVKDRRVIVRIDIERAGPDRAG